MSGRASTGGVVSRLLVVLAIFVSAQPGAAAMATPEPEDDLVRVTAWNIWRGGRTDGDEVGPQRVVDVIRKSGADIVAMQETYGSGEMISGALGFHFHPRGTNVSIHSRWPVVEDISVHEPFRCVGGLIDVPDGRRIAMYSIWLPYDADIWLPGERDTNDPASMLAACRASARELATIRASIDQRLADPKYAGVPIVIAGDFNAMSHVDYGEIGLDQYDVAIDWPTTRVMTEAGYRDAFRETNPVIDRAADRTWSPRFPEQEADRIDFVFTRGGSIEPISARMIDTHPDGFPSDHGAVIAELRVTAPGVPVIAPSEGATTVRAATANIKHGRGMDGNVDLGRTAAMLASLDADVIGLQEVDLGVRRSGEVNQATVLGQRLGMHAAFGAFMPYGGGHYGMGILSKFPIRDVRSIRLPGGNEPRVALTALVCPSGGTPVTVVNVHFDWVADDGFRFAQAEALAAELDRLETPYILLGDFNDVPESRTLSLFRDRATEADKPAEARFTFPADEPRTEIDFVFAGPAERWSVAPARVVPEKIATDHRPVVATLRFKGEG